MCIKFKFYVIFFASVLNTQNTPYSYGIVSCYFWNWFIRGRAYKDAYRHPSIVVDAADLTWWHSDGVVGYIHGAHRENSG